MRFFRILLALIVIVVAAYLLMVGLASPRTPSRYVASLPTGVSVLAHAGGAGLWPDNTMRAFEGSVAAGADVLELDVQESSDDVLMVIHDDTVDRTTNGTGTVASQTSAQLQTLDAGYWWTPEGTAGPDGGPVEQTPGASHADTDVTYRYRDEGITIPTLQQVFDAFPTVPINIEIKPDDAGTAADLCALIRRNDRLDSVMVASFHAHALRSFRDACPSVATSADKRATTVFYVLARARLAATATPVMDALQVPEFQGNLRVVTPHFVQAAHARGVRVEVWTVNDVQSMRRLIDMGVDGIITDRPDRALALLGRGQEFVPPEGVAP